MGKFVKRDVVVLNFPFSYLSTSKKRPALVLSELDGNDIILCQITSKPYDKYAIKINNSDFDEGNLFQESYIKPARIFTADESIIVKWIGSVNHKIYAEVVDKIYVLIKEDGFDYLKYHGVSP